MIYYPILYQLYHLSLKVLPSVIRVPMTHHPSHGSSPRPSPFRESWTRSTIEGKPQKIIELIMLYLEKTSENLDKKCP